MKKTRRKGKGEERKETGNISQNDIENIRREIVEILIGTVIKAHPTPSNKSKRMLEGIGRA